MAEVGVPTAVVSYGADEVEESMLVGYVVQIGARHTARRFTEWCTLRKRLGRVDKRVLDVAFPEKEVMRHLGTHIFKSTNKSKRLIEVRRAGLDAFVRQVAALGGAAAADMERSLFEEPLSKSAQALSLGAGPPGRGSEAVVRNAFRFPEERLDCPMPRLRVHLPWGYLALDGHARIVADTAADATLRFAVFVEVYRWFSRLLDKLPSLVRTTDQTRMYMLKAGLPAAEHPGMLPTPRPDPCCCTCPGGAAACTGCAELRRGDDASVSSSPVEGGAVRSGSSLTAPTPPTAPSPRLNSPQTARERRRCMRRRGELCAEAAAASDSESEVGTPCCISLSAPPVLPPTHHDPFEPMAGPFPGPDGAAVDVTLSLTEASEDEGGRHVHHHRVPTRKAQRWERAQAPPNTDVKTWSGGAPVRYRYRTY
eukprot:TRINITY_DN30046_c0_g1_i1.p1 TRINITY_DN30046_c0_g1~~TRINITY_DN30046_c0_g1_i1.p1  ORF type:complete len:440 (+),score=113.44 TRINITY_DN30046_c0_g1_i1:50-1321(+)